MTAWLIRTLLENDIPQLVALCNTSHPYDPVAPEKFQQLYQLPHYDPTGMFVAEHEGKIIGFMPTIIYKEGHYKDPIFANTGCILSVVIHPDYETTDLGDVLLTRALAYLQAQGKTIIDVASFKPFRFFPHYDTRHTYPIALLQKHGFEPLRELVDVTKSLVDFQTPQWAVDIERQLQGEGLRFDYCTERYQADFLAFLDEHFWEAWYLKNKRFVDERGDPRTRLLAIWGDKVVGYVYFDVEAAVDTAGTVGKLSQTGVMPSLRSKKIGSVLVFKAMAEMQARGATSLEIYWCPWGFYQITEGEIMRARVQLRKIIAKTDEQGKGDVES
ncbi:MAG: GNAT family N-acetyltransferase [Chloroflexota bacterium]